jgi:hypothetical protein
MLALLDDDLPARSDDSDILSVCIDECVDRLLWTSVIALHAIGVIIEY